MGRVLQRVGKCLNFIAPVDRSPCIKYKLVITFDTIILKNIAHCRSNCRSREHANLWAAVRAFQSPSRTAYENTPSQRTSLLCLAITVTCIDFDNFWRKRYRESKQSKGILFSFLS